MWNIDSHPLAPVTEAPNGMRVAVLIPTYNEPIEVLTPTVAAACELAPAHETWVLDDGDRPWVEEMCVAYGARYVRRAVHDHAKAGNMNHALALMASERPPAARESTSSRSWTATTSRCPRSSPPPWAGSKTPGSP